MKLLESTDVPRSILTYGRFDMFHQGHLQFLQHLAQMCDDVIVGCATDEFAQSNGTPCYMPYEHRRDVLENSRYVSRVIPQLSFGQERTDIINYNVSTLAIGPKEHGHLEDLQDIVLVLYMPRYSPKQLAPSLADYRQKIAS